MNLHRSLSLPLQSNVKAGTVNGLATNHSETLKVASQVKAGLDGLATNHNEKLVVASKLKAGEGIRIPNHNETLRIRA